MAISIQTCTFQIDSTFQGSRETSLYVADNYDAKQSLFRPEPDRAPVKMSQRHRVLAAQFSVPESTYNGTQLERQGSLSIPSSEEPASLPVLQRQLTYPPGELVFFCSCCMFNVAMREPIVSSGFRPARIAPGCSRHGASFS